MSDEIISLNGESRFLTGAKALVIPTNEIFVPGETEQTVSANNVAEQIIMVPWGRNNRQPQEIRAAVEKSTDMGAAMLFNISMGYGDGIQPVRIITDSNGNKVAEPVVIPEIVDFFEQNNINPLYTLEQMTDLFWYYNTFPEIILDKAGRKILEINHKEAEFSRLSQMNKETGQIEWHLYSGKWDKGAGKADIEATRYLNQRRPYFDLLEQVKKGHRRFIVPTAFPTPGRAYYQKPYWYSLIESGWYDFAIAIPEFKRALLKNQMAIRFLIEIDPRYWDLIFKKEGITADEDKKARVALEFKNLNEFLVGEKKAGKGWVVPMEYSQTAKEARSFIKITEIKTDFGGGEYLQDASDVSNTIAYAMGVHSGLIGSAPGKNSGSLSGTDKREMFIIKQALLKPFRDILLAPFYLAKQMNGWPKDLQFTIPNIVLTTLDQNTGSKTTIS